jgi:hypothetical protein
MAVAGAAKGVGWTLAGGVLGVAALLGCNPQPLAGFRPGGGADAGIDGASSACQRSCPDGGCQPIVLASGLDTPYGLVIDDANAYWIGGSAASVDGGPGSAALMKVGLAGGDPVVLASGLNQPVALTLDATNVYWDDAASLQIMGVPKAGGAAFQVATASSSPYGIGIDDRNIYWAQPDAGNIQAVPIHGGAITTVATTVGDRPWELAVTPNYLLYSASSKIGRAPKDGGQQWILTYDDLPGALAIDTTNVYFAAHHAMDPKGVDLEPGVTIEVAAIAGSTPIILASPEFEPGGLTSDGVNLYWTEGGDGAIMAVPVTGGAPVQIVGGQVDPGSIASDCANIYWTNSYGSDGGYGGGTLMKLAKP